MKSKLSKDEVETTPEPESPATKRRSRKKPDADDDSANSGVCDEEYKPSTSKESRKIPVRKNVTKKVIKRKGIQKTLRSRRQIAAKEKLKATARTAKQTGKKAVKANVKTASTKLVDNDKSETLIPPAEIKKEVVEDNSVSNSRSSSPAAAPRHASQKMTPDWSIVRTCYQYNDFIFSTGSSTYSPNEPRKSLRLVPQKKPIKLLNEVVKKELKKRGRQLSESKLDGDEPKKRKRVLSRDGSEISKCSDVTESDISLSETPALEVETNSEAKDEKNDPKTELDIADNSLSNMTKNDRVPCTHLDRKSRDSLPGTTSSGDIKRNEQLKRSSSLDIDNNNAKSRSTSTDKFTDEIKKELFKTENEQETERTSILDNMSRTFNKLSPKDIKSMRRKYIDTTLWKGLNKSDEALLEEIKDKINEDQKEPTAEVKGTPTESENLCDKSPVLETSNSPEEENMRLSLEEKSPEKYDICKENAGYRAIVVSNVQDISSLMDKLKNFEEQAKKHEMKSKNTQKPSTPSNDIVLIPKLGVDVKSLKNVQSTNTNDKPPLKENLLSCFENNSAISILRKDHARKSVDLDIPNSITLIKRNSLAGRKDSTASNPSKDTSDALTLIEKSLGREVTLEIRKSIDKASNDVQTVKPLGSSNHQDVNAVTIAQNIAGVVFDSNQITITKEPKPDTVKTIRKSLEFKDPIVNVEADIVTDNDNKVNENLDSEVKENIVMPKSNEETDEKDNLLEAINKALDDEPGETKEEITEAEKEITTDNQPTFAEDIAQDPPKCQIPIDEKNDCETNQQTELVVTNPIETEKKEDLKIVLTKDKSPKGKLKQSPTKIKEPKLKDKKETSNMLWETPENQKRKENVLRTLGLLTHKAADEAKIEKAKQKEIILANAMNNKMIKGKGRDIKDKNSSMNDYTGTLKTVIKLNRNSSEKKRAGSHSSLKITFQKSKGRGGKASLEHSEEGIDFDEFYTIHKEGTTGATGDITGGHRKTHYSNRFNNNDPTHAPLETSTVDAKDKPSLVIPEKASSFSIHPGRLCQDQCFYCGGKFGLFDTPCHIAQMKSHDRQKKVLDNEEKLTVDSCLCDACYRHVDRRANCSSYRKRPVNSKAAETQPNPFAFHDEGDHANAENGGEQMAGDRQDLLGPRNGSKCHAEGCVAIAMNSIRRKWLIKMRSSVSKVLNLKMDYPGLHTIPLCNEHYKMLSHLMVCGLCTRRLTKHHNTHYINQAIVELNPLLTEQGIPVTLEEKAVVCKICRYYCTLLTKPQQQANKSVFMKAHRIRLLQVYNIEVPPEEVEQTEQEEEELMEQNEEDKDADNLEDCEKDRKRKKNAKSKNRKSTDSNKTSEDGSENLSRDDSKSLSPMEEDIESLISSNKIPVPNAASDDALAKLEAAVIPALDKQSELQYLLQKQNNPAQFLQKPYSKQKTPGKIMKPQLKNDKLVKKIQKLGQVVTTKKDGKDLSEMTQSLGEEISVEPISANKKVSPDISLLKNKWVMSESFSQVKKNLSELSKNISSDQIKKDPVRRLEGNSSLSVREILPGEEEIGLSCNIEFDNVRETTQEGWEKCQSTIQYDIKTKKLWEELQRPYGNQSSFLRHLLVLEKYYRSGDLVLANNATPHAVTYSSSVTSRLRAYDNILPPPNTSSLIDFRRQKPGKSLLKISQSGPPNVTVKPKLNNAQKPIQKTNLPNLPVVLPPSVVIEAKPATSKAKPPELIAINSSNTGRKSIENVLKNIQQLVRGVSAPKSPSPKAIDDQSDTNKEKPNEPSEPSTPKNESVQNPNETVTTVESNSGTPEPVLTTSTPKTEVVKKNESAKPKTPVKGWRPTLMPITQENTERIAKEIPQPAADGRLLPSLVQVMSKGKRYHITLKDYNKMCVMRREKLKERENLKEVRSVTNIEPSLTHGNGGTLMQNVTLPTTNFKNVTITTQSSTISLPAAIAQLGPAVSVTTEMVPEPPKAITGTTITAAPALNAYPLHQMPQGLPKIPKSLTVIPQTVSVNTGMVVPINIPMFSGMPLTMAPPNHPMILPNQRP